MKFDLSIIVPVFNEAGNIEGLLKRVNDSMKKADINYQLLFIDDRSTDSTVNEINMHKKALPVRVYTKVGKQGKAYSILEGSRYAESDFIAMIDGDLQYPPEILPELLRIATKEGVAVGNRQKRHTSKLRQLISKANRFVLGKLLLGMNVDAQSGIKVFRKEIIDQMNEQDVSPWAFDMPLLHTALELGYSIGSFDMEFSERKEGSSKVNIIKTATQIAKQALKLKFKRNKTYQIKPENNNSSIGAGVVHKKNRYITHTTLRQKDSAMQVVVGWQKAMILIALLIFVIGIIFNAWLTLVILIAFLSLIYFADMAFNLYVLIHSLRGNPELKFDLNKLNEEQKIALLDKNLPIYSILCPLYKEAEVLPEFVKSIATIEWPKNKLDVMLLLEENDKETIDAAKRLNLPEYIRIVVVPHSLPKTKPKACNYGLHVAKGEYVVIYDAEDRPDPLQLKKSYLGFLTVGPKVFCLQSKLNYYNPHQNFLTRLFTAEYSLWFDLTLPGLQSIETAIPLGGTSNHFRTADLKKVNGWDPFNVTEDCDLGVRLFRQGYKTAVIDSTTYEEANSSVRNWIRQRSRWIKGYLQTYLVHTREPIKLFKENGFDALIMQLIIGMRVTFILINPILWLTTISYFALHRYLGAAISSLYPTPVFYIAIVSLIFGNFIAFYSYMIGLAKRGQWGILKFVFLIPFYWIITSIASYIALYQLIFKPHYWEKTKHGLNIKTIVKNPSQLSVEEKKKEINEIKGFSKSGILSGGFLVFASIVGNFFNFLYNAYLGRVTSPDVFGVIGLIGSLLYITMIPTGGIGKTVTYESALLFGRYNTIIKSYWSEVRKRFVLVSLVITLLWLLAIPLLMNVFHSNTPLPFLLFAPVWFIGFVGAVDGGFLSGNLFFYVIGVATALEAITKFLAAYLIVTFGRADLVYAATPISMAVSFLLSYIVILILKSKEKDIKVEKKFTRFSGKFFTTSILAKVASISFLSLDVILAKAYLSPSEAGKYALLSLTGSMIFFFGGLFSQFITPIVSNIEGKGKSSKHAFHVLLIVTSLSAFVAFVTVGIFGNFTDVLLLGNRAYGILPYVFQYGLAMVAFTVVVNIVSYHQIKGHHIFPILSFVFALIQIGVTFFFHQNIDMFVDIMFGLAMSNLVVFLTLNWIYIPMKIIAGNLSDFFGIFTNSVRFKKQNKSDSDALRILIFNWRDTKHIWAGGAENYLHEIAKRWIKEGHSVTIFCGNDSKNPRNEMIEGIQIVRRGGFYTVYIWAALYYILKFRGKFDLIIDSENGLPFFTPIYARIPKYLLIHHVHQDVFREHLKFPFNQIAMVIERVLMPFVYKNQRIITVSNSSRIDVLKLINHSNYNIEIVTPGVTLADYKKTKKTSYPSFVYLGRLKPYKNIDIAILAFSKIAEKYKDAKFFIVGDGESIDSLKKLSEKLNLSEMILFTGKVTHAEKVQMFGKAWVSIQPSSFEGWGMTVIEANACGTPVIASNVKGLKDSVVDGKTGLLVTAKNADLFAKTMEDLIKDSEYRNQLSADAYLWAKEFGWEVSAEHFMEIIKRREEKLTSESFEMEAA